MHSNNHSTKLLFIVITIMIMAGIFRQMIWNEKTSQEVEDTEKDVFKEYIEDDRPSVFGVFMDRSIKSLARCMVMVHSARQAGNTLPFVVFITTDDMGGVLKMEDHHLSSQHDDPLHEEDLVSLLDEAFGAQIVSLHLLSSHHHIFS